VSIPGEPSWQMLAPENAAVPGAEGKPEWGPGMREAFLRSSQKGAVAHDKGVEERFSSARWDRASRRLLRNRLPAEGPSTGILLRKTGGRAMY